MAHKKQLSHHTHDTTFRALLSNKLYAKDFFNRHLPAHIKEIIDLNSLEFCKESYVDEDLKLLQIDVLYKANFNSGNGYLYMVVEHQSTVQKLMAWRMHKYVLRIMDDYIKNHKKDQLPIVIANVYYHGKKPYTAGTNLYDLFGKNKDLAKLSLFNYNLFDVTKIPNQQLKQATISAIGDFITKHIKARNIMIYIEQISDILQILNQDKKHEEPLTNLMQYVTIEGKAEDKSSLIEHVKQILSGGVGNTMATIAQELRAEGKLEGSQETTKLIITNLINIGMDFELIAQSTATSVEEVIKISKDCKVSSN